VTSSVGLGGTSIVLPLQQAVGSASSGSGSGSGYSESLSIGPDSSVTQAHHHSHPWGWILSLGLGLLAIVVAIAVRRATWAIFGIAETFIPVAHYTASWTSDWYAALLFVGAGACFVAAGTLVALQPPFIARLRAQV
jgi:hypothetical protein